MVSLMPRKKKPAPTHPADLEVFHLTGIMTVVCKGDETWDVPPDAMILAVPCRPKPTGVGKGDYFKYCQHSLNHPITEIARDHDAGYIVLHPAAYDHIYDMLKEMGGLDHHGEQNVCN